MDRESDNVDEVNDFMFSISVSCKPCSDEEVLLAVCTSDFGKYTHIYIQHSGKYSKVRSSKQPLLPALCRNSVTAQELYVKN